MWPAVIVDESIIGERKGLNNKVSGGGSLLVQFFGTHDFARLVSVSYILKKSRFSTEMLRSMLHIIKLKLTSFGFIE
jgi:hypothetical protein